MPTTAAERLVDAYLDAIAAHDTDAVRALISAPGFRYESPIARFDDTDAFVQFVAMSTGILQRIERRHRFVDGDDICHWLVFVTQLSERIATPAVQWAQVRDGRIASIELMFDPYRYRLLFDVDDPTDTGRNAVC